MAKPVITPLEVMEHALARNKEEPPVTGLVLTRVLRSVITPFSQRYARRLKIGIQRYADHLARIVDVDGEARYVPGKRAEVLHARLFGPQEGVKGCVAGEIRKTDYLIPAVDGIGLNSVPVPRPAEVAQVGNRAGLPKQGVERLEIDKRGRVEGCAFARSSGNVAVAVDPERDSIQIARVRR